MFVKVFHQIFSFRIISKFFISIKRFFLLFARRNIPKMQIKALRQSQHRVFDSDNKLHIENTKVYLIKKIGCGIPP